MAKTPVPVGAPKVPASVVDHRERLEALRDRLEAALTDAAHRDLAPIAARYQAVLSELAALPEAKGSDDVDDLAARRRARRSGTEG